ncbi:MAG: acireductone synthase [Pseudomonadota bacterium]
MISTIITDIEGTTSSLSFVKDTLFPYAKAHLPGFIHKHKAQPAVREQLIATAQTAELDVDDEEALLAQLLAWIDADIKATPLKTLQGMVWKNGYEQGHYQAHIYADAKAKLEEWHALGLPLFVYSSGSVQAQQLFFQYSEFADIRYLFSGYFDTTIGNKHEPESYGKIIEKEGLSASRTLFLSDVEVELDAAAASKMQTARLLREQDYGVTPTDIDSKHPVFASFSSIDLAQI